MRIDGVGAVYRLGARVTTELCRAWRTRGEIRGLLIGRRLSSPRVLWIMAALTV